jgi:hypothetical protein
MDANKARSITEAANAALKDGARKEMEGSVYGVIRTAAERGKSTTGVYFTTDNAQWIKEALRAQGYKIELSKHTQTHAGRDLYTVSWQDDTPKSELITYNQAMQALAGGQCIMVVDNGNVYRKFEGRYQVRHGSRWIYTQHDEADFSTAGPFTIFVDPTNP